MTYVLEDRIGLDAGSAPPRSNRIVFGSDEPVGLGRTVAVGSLLGLAIGTHLMAAPVMVIALWMLASERRQGSRWSWSPAVS
jgi:hypothetical protein